jgi:DNA-binding NarL/FixJ family response regulator
MTRGEALERGRESAAAQKWGAAFDQLSAADNEAPLEPEDLVSLATAAQLTGHEADAGRILARAHAGFLARSDTRAAARCAFWLGFLALTDGVAAESSGWLARARRLLEGEPDCVENGYLLVPDAIRAARGGDAATAYAAFVRAAEIGERFADHDLVTLALHGQGRVLVRQGDAARGMALLDEAMVAVAAGEVSPLAAGAVYCSVIESCREAFDMRRAREWTDALERWCESQPDRIPYRGHCLLSRAEILQWRGAWADALQAATRACQRLSEPTAKPSLGAAFYLVGELHRLRGELAEAEEAYRQAARWEHTARPGLARLRLVQGRLDAAHAAIRRSADEAHDARSRAGILDAYVEIVLAAGDVPAARAAAEELTALAGEHGAPLLRAMAARATGAVLLAEGNTRAALASLRASWATWCELEAPHDAARVRVLIALACRDEGDEDGAGLELAAAGRAFEELGAVADRTRVETLRRANRSAASTPLTAREVEVLKLVTAGLTNRELAGRLGISEKTVARHMSNIFLKLGVSSRAAATSYAHRHHLV